MDKKSSSKREVYIVDGARTPFIKAAGVPNKLTATDLAVNSINNLLLRQTSISTENFDEVVVGCVAPSAKECNIARVISLRTGFGNRVTAYTVQRNCASGMQAIHSAAKEIWLGKKDLIMAGGTEAMSRSPMLFSDEMTEWLAKFMSSKPFIKKLQVIPSFRFKFLKPVISLLLGLSDQVVNMNMGQTAEKVAHMYGLSREELDTYAAESHKRALHAQQEGYFKNEMTVMSDFSGNAYDFDNGVRVDSTLEKLSKLKPVFERPFGKITAGNSSQITDGAAFVILASKEAVDKYSLPVLGKLVDVRWSGLDPEIMGMGPAYSIGSILSQNNLKVSDIDYWEINEAFASQVLGSVIALNDDKFCKEELGLKSSLGLIDKDKLNIDGGAIAIGHPVGASGARLILHLLHILKRNNAKRGVASLCIGGGQGGATLLEI